eukprot:979185-Heterocapsa_arctica.AAC.1
MEACSRRAGNTLPTCTLLPCSCNLVLPTLTGPTLACFSRPLLRFIRGMSPHLRTRCSDCCRWSETAHATPRRI